MFETAQSILRKYAQMFFMTRAAFLIGELLMEQWFILLSFDILSNFGEFMARYAFFICNTTKGFMTSKAFIIQILMPFNQLSRINHYMRELIN